MLKRELYFFLYSVIISSSASAQYKWQMQPVAVQTRWAKEVSPEHTLVEYPRPQMVRAEWQNLNGLWQYTVTPKDAAMPSNYEGTILVPYPIESALSGVKKPVLPHQNLWYRRSFDKPVLKNGERVLLNFGAVDWQATVYVNSELVGDHTGGYQSFSIDITEALQQGKNELVVKVYDPTDQGPNPHGKQVLAPADIYYTATTGIWQTVWMEVVPAAAITGIKLNPDIDQKLLNATIYGPSDCEVILTASENGKPISTVEGIPGTIIRLPIKQVKLWSPNDPFLYDLNVTLVKGGSIVDSVKSYFGMRKVEIKKDAAGFDRIFLNNQYTYNLGTLDQGFWPEGIMTAPTDEALAFDIKAIKAMGFNTIRKHIKVEPARWYYYCDKLGMLVWQDFVNPPHHLPLGAKEEFEKEVAATMEQLHNHPCIITWVLFNEKWGVFDQQRLTEWVKKKDPSRLVNGHSGEMLWVNEQLRSPSPNAWVSADMTDVHSYPDPMNAPAHEGKARILGEFGGIGVFIPNHQWNPMNAWGYIQVTPSGLRGKYTVMNQHLKLLEREGLSGSFYTQPFDVEGEQNGLLTYDREIVKIPFEELRKIHSQLLTNMGATPAVTAKVADVIDPGILYSELLQQYIDGKKDEAFLRKLAMTAQQVGDKLGARRVGADYIAGLKAPYSIEDFNYILQMTNSTKDAGFAFLQQNAAEINRVFGARKADVKMMNLIYQDVIHSFTSNQTVQPDWSALAEKVNKYGTPGEEILLRAKTIYFLNSEDWNNFAKAANEYVDKYGQYLSPDELNQYAWTAFERVNNPSLLEPALAWSQLSLKSGDQPIYLDTYANLLYKLGRKEEAIRQQEKAVSMVADAALREKLEKMKRGEKTWR